MFFSFLMFVFSHCSKPCQSCGLDFRTSSSCWTSSITSCSICSPTSPLRLRFFLKVIWTACWGRHRWRRTSREWLSPQVWLTSPTDTVCQLLKWWTPCFPSHIKLDQAYVFNVFFPPFCRSVERILPAETKTQEWLLPETMASFNDLLLQYNGVCGYTLVNRDGLLLPGTVVMIHQFDVRNGICVFLLCRIIAYG